MNFPCHEQVWPFIRSTGAHRTSPPLSCERPIRQLAGGRSRHNRKYCNHYRRISLRYGCDTVLVFKLMANMYQP